jgi:hypothetical protein
MDTEEKLIPGIDTKTYNKKKAPLRELGFF